MTDSTARSSGGFEMVYDQDLDALFLRARTLEATSLTDRDGEMWVRRDTRGNLAGLDIERFTSIFLDKHEELDTLWLAGDPDVFLEALLAYVNTSVQAGLDSREMANALPTKPAARTDRLRSRLGAMHRMVSTVFAAPIRHAVATFGLHAIEALSAAGDDPVTLVGAPSGLRAEVRWPVPGRRKVVQLVVAVDDWRAARLAENTPARVEIDVDEPPAGVAWADWIANGGIDATIEPGHGEAIIPLTQPNPELGSLEIEILRTWLSEGIRAIAISQEQQAGS